MEVFLFRGDFHLRDNDNMSSRRRAIVQSSIPCCVAQQWGNQVVSRVQVWCAVHSRVITADAVTDDFQE